MNFKKFISGVSALTIAASAFAGMAVTANAATDAYVVKLNDTAPQTSSFTGSATYLNTTFDTLSAGETVAGLTADSDCVYYNVRSLQSKKEGYDFEYTYDLSTAIGSSTDYKISYDLAFYSEATKGRNHFINLKSADGTVIVSFDGRGTKNNVNYPGCKTFADTGYTTNSSIAICTWYTMSVAVKDGKLSASLTSKDTGTSMWSVSNVTYDSSTYGAISGLSFKYGYSTGVLFLDNIYVSTKESVDIDNVTLSGDSTIYGDAQYSATVNTTINSTSYEVEDAVTYAIDSQTANAGYTGGGDLSINATTGALTVPNGWYGTATISATSSLDNSVKATKDITVVADVGYVVETTPYAKVVANGITVYAGKDGRAQFPVNTEGEFETEISKNGYVTITPNLTFANNGTSGDKTLTAESGITYYEDFENVYQVGDNFGYNSDIATVTSDGKLKSAFKNISSNDLSPATISLPSDVPIEGKLVTMNMLIGNSNAYVKFGDLQMYSRVGLITGPGMNSGDGKGVNINDGKYHLIQVYVPTATTDRYSFYVDGKKYSDYNCSYYNGNSTASTIALACQYSMNLFADYLKVSDKPADFVINTSDESVVTAISGTYITGFEASAVLPEATGKDGYIFKGWSKDGGTTLVDAGETVTATSATTYEAIYEEVEDPTASAAQYGKDIPADEGYEGTDTVASVFRAEVTAGSYDITSVQFTLNNGAKTTGTWSGNIASGSPVVFGLIVPMAGADVNNIKAVLNGASYDAYVK